MNSPAGVLSAGAIPWWQSKVQIANIVSLVTALIALFPKIGELLGVKTPDEVKAWVETVFGILTLLAPIFGSIWRARSALQPLTLTQGGVAAHPATISVVTANAGQERADPLGPSTETPK